MAKDEKIDPLTIAVNILKSNGMDVKNAIPLKNGKGGFISAIQTNRGKIRELKFDIEGITLTRKKLNNFGMIIENCIVKVPYDSAVAGIRKVNGRLIFTIMAKSKDKKFGLINVTVMVWKKGKARVEIATGDSPDAFKFGRIIADYVIAYGEELI